MKMIQWTIAILGICFPLFIFLWVIAKTALKLSAF